MAIETVTMYRVLCDRCGVSAQDDAEFYAWADAEQAVDSAIESEWVAIEGKHYCEDCVEWNEDDDQLVPRPPWERESGPDHSGPQERRVTPMVNKGSFDFTITVHHEAEGWWAESGQLPGWSAAAADASALQHQIADYMREAHPGASYNTFWPRVGG